MDFKLNLRYALFILVAVFMLPLTAQDIIEQVAQNLRTDIIREGDAPMTLSDRMKNYNVPGVSIAVVQDFKLAGVKTYGVKEAGAVAAISPETPFQSASISKLVNAIGIMKLVEAGKLDLDQNINEILKGWQIPPSSEYPDAVITVRMILTHSAGLSNHGFDGYKSPEGLPTILDILNTAKGVQANPFKIIIEPGTTFKYSGGGTLLTQLLIEEMSGKSYPEYMQEAVLQPLGMNNSFYSVNQAGREDQLATAHLANGKPLKGKYRFYPESAAAGLWSTPTDLSKVMIDLMLAFKGEEGRLLKPETAKAMLEPTAASNNCALGLFRNDKNGHLYFEHGGANEGFMANFVGSASGGYGAIVMQNGERYDLVPEVINSIASVYAWNSWFSPESTVAAGVTEEKSLWKAYEGHYTSEKDKASSFDVKVKKGKLMMSRPKAWNLPLVLVATNKYLLKGASPAVTVEFVEDGELKVTQGEVTIYWKE
jgi:CubicO group peptidase (beta-lactamase class C family)